MPSGSCSPTWASRYAWATLEDDTPRVSLGTTWLVPMASTTARCQFALRLAVTLLAPIASAGPNRKESVAHDKCSRRFCGDRRTAAAASACVGVRRSMAMWSRQPTGGERPNAKENGPISPSAAVRAARGSGSRPRRQPGLSERGKSAKIRATSGVIRGIPVKSSRHGFLC